MVIVASDSSAKLLERKHELWAPKMHSLAMPGVGGEKGGEIPLAPLAHPTKVKAGLRFIFLEKVIICKVQWYDYFSGLRATVWTWNNQTVKTVLFFSSHKEYLIFSGHEALCGF